MAGENNNLLDYLKGGGEIAGGIIGALNPPRPAATPRPQQQRNRGLDLQKMLPLIIGGGLLLVVVVVLLSGRRR